MTAEHDTRQQLRQTIAELGMVSNGSTRNYEGAGKATHDSRAPHMAREPNGWPGRHTPVTLSRRIQGADGINDPEYRLAALKAILDDAEKALECWTKRQPRSQSVRGEFDFALDVAAELRRGIPDAAVATNRQMTREEVRRIRKRYVA